MTKHNVRSTVTGRFIPKTKVVTGKLYEYKGVVVRAKKLCSNGFRLVSSPQKLNGFVRDEELQPINKKEAVKRYIQNA